MYDVASLVGLSLLAIGALLVMATRKGRDQEEVDRRFDEIVDRLDD